MCNLMTSPSSDSNVKLNLKRRRNLTLTRAVNPVCSKGGGGGGGDNWSSKNNFGINASCQTFNFIFYVL